MTGLCRGGMSPAASAAERKRAIEDNLQAIDDAHTRSGALGIAVDAYHVWWDPRLEHAVARAGASRLLAYHICDWLVPMTDLLLDRGMMGDGVIDLPRLRELVERTGYCGFHEVEIFSQNNRWRRDPDEVLTTCKERYANCS